MNIDTWEKFFLLTPVVVVCLSVVGIGWYVGYKSRNDHIETLKSWVESLKKEK